MMGDQDGFAITLDGLEEVGGLTLQGGDEFGSHGVILKYHSPLRHPNGGSARDPAGRSEWESDASIPTATLGGSCACGR